MVELGQNTGNFRVDRRIRAAGASVRETAMALPRVWIQRSVEEVVYVPTDQYRPVPVGQIDGITVTVCPPFESDLSHRQEIPVVLKGNELAVSAYSFGHFDIPVGNIMQI